MSYLELLHLSREPFSNSPDPETFYSGQTHSICLNRLEIAIRLRRGLNVVLGPVGTGKSTLCRRLLRNLAGQKDIETFFLLDAGSTSTLGFIRQLIELLDQQIWDGTDTQAGIGALQTIVFEKALKQNHNLVLLIDEGQKLSPEALEVLRVLLNFETNTEKLLQIVIFAQPEFAQTIASMPNFEDRINERLELDALPWAESLDLLRYRLRMAGGVDAQNLFTKSALTAIYRQGRGRPRQMIRLAHQSLLAMIMANQSRVSASLVRSQVRRNGQPVRSVKAVVVCGVLAVAAAVAVAAWYFSPAVRERLHATVDTLSQTSAWIAIGPSRPTALLSVPSAQLPTPVEGQVLVEEPVRSGPSVDGTARPAAVKNAPAATEPVVAELLGEVHLAAGTGLTQAAELFYGTAAAEPVLRQANPHFDGSTDTVVRLPAVEFAVPAYLRRNLQLSLGQFDTAEEAYRAYVRWTAVRTRLVARRDAQGAVTFHVVARASFRSTERAWLWLSVQKPLQGIAPRLLPVYGAEESALYSFK